MAIALATEYPYAEAPSAEYPGGSFKNDSTGIAGDGTPLEKQWANDFLGFFQALLSGAGAVASGAPDTAVNSQYLQALQSLMWSPGDTKFCFYSTPEARWLELNGNTIGNATSAASARANADTAALFAKLWALSPLQLYTSGAAPVARGASAAVDFAAHRQIALPDMRGRAPRGWDHGAGVDIDRLLGSNQLDAIQNITGTFNSANSAFANVASGAFAGGGVAANSAGDSSGGQPATTFDASRVVRTGTETRMKNTAGMFVIRY